MGRSEAVVAARSFVWLDVAVGIFSLGMLAAADFGTVPLLAWLAITLPLHALTVAFVVRCETDPADRWWWGLLVAVGNWPGALAWLRHDGRRAG